jgi:PAS domain S-box-containing protein/putative nucleotidyltransferase with HDIG domain
MIENGTDLIYITDAQGTITYASPISTKYLGYRSEEMLGTSAFDYVYPQDRGGAVAAFQGVVQKTHDQKAMEFKLRHKDGTWLPYEAVAANLLDDPVVLGIIINCRSLNERKQAQKVQESIYQISELAFMAENMEDLFRAMHAIISELMPAGNFYVALYDEENQFIHFPYFIDEYDEPPGPTPFGRGLTEYVLTTGEPLLASPEKFEELVQEGKVDQIGAPSIDWLGVPLRASENTLGVLVVQSYTENIRFNEIHKSILTFVSEQAAMSIARKKVEEALRESETRYRSLFEDSPISIWEEDFSEIKAHIDELRSKGVTDFKTYFDEHPEQVVECMSRVRVIDVNRTTLRMYAAHSKEELLNNLNRVFGSETLEMVKRELVAVADGRQEFEGTGVNYRINGSRIDIVIRWLAFPGDKDAYSRIIVSIMDITERRRAEEQVQSQIQRLNALRAIDTSITGSLDLRSTLNVLLEQVTTQLNVDAAAVLLLDQNILALEYAAGRGFRTAALQHTHLRVGEGYAGRAALERCLISNPDLQNDPGVLACSPLLERECFIAYFALPLIAKGQVKGVLEIFHRSPLQPSQEWLEFLETLGRQAAIAIDNASLFNDLQHSNLELTLAYDATIVGWSRALDLRDRETEGHTQRVTELTVRLAQLIGVPKKDLVFLRWGALLHDIGKMGIPDSILLKPGPLTPEEHTTMRQHPVYAYQMLLPIHYLRPALDIPYYHHERWDGKGYPCGLKGDEIPLSARIFSIIDVYDALCSERPYREAWPEKKALSYIESQSGLHFDPIIVTGFMTMIANEDLPASAVPAEQVRLEASSR